MSNIPAILFKSPSQFILAEGAAADLGIHLKKLGVKKALLVTDEVIQKIGTADQVMEAAKAQGLAFALYAETLPEPPVENVNEALEIYRSQGCDGVVGLGGGSPLDVAKAVAMLAANGGKYEDYAGIGKVPNKSAPMVLMPTTAGTGSEVSMFSILLVKGSKVGVVDSHICADVALVDPLLTLSVPRKVTAATGLDAFCHHLESFLSTNQSPFCSAICLEGIRVISANLRKAFADGANQEARYWMSYGSAIGGYVMNLTEGAAANHALAFALGAKFHIGHGLSNAVMLPYVFPLIIKGELDRVRQIGQAMGENMEGLSDYEAMEITCQAIRNLVQDVGCLIPLKELGVGENDLEALAAETQTQVRVLGHSTYKLTAEEIKGIFRQAL